MTLRARILALFDDVRVVGVALLATGAVAVGISYSAQNGLPGAGTQHVYADVPDASKLTVHADVRIGGARVGQVLGIAARRGGAGRPPFARLRLGLDRGVRVPVDSTAEVRLASVLGGKYLALVPGRATRVLREGAGLPLRQAIASVDAEQALSAFGAPTRRALRVVVDGLGDGVAGRGRGLNDAIVHLAAAAPAGDRVLQTLLSGQADLPGLLRGLAAATSAFAPVAGRAGALAGNGARTLAALDRTDPALSATLRGLPPTQDALTRALRAAAPALRDAAALSTALRPAAARLPSASRALAAAARTAIPVAHAAGTIATPLRRTFAAVDRFARSATSRKALEALGTNDLATFGGSAFVGLGAILQTAAEAQLHCNALSLWVRNLASTASEGDSGGHWLRMVPILALPQMQHAKAPASDLHVNVYPHEDAAECEAGNEPYLPGRRLGNPAGDQATTVDQTGPAGR